ncbi:MAG: hypothetical protein HY682_02150 [Chloroflexi bacterium]|nr:hypothetical protein [Chloroflexota bacterium]
MDLLTAKGDQTVAAPCYFFTFSDFCRFPHISGAVSLFPKGAQLYLNPISRQVEQLRGSRLFLRLAAASAATDPQASEHDGEAFIAATGIGRDNEADVLSYLRQKYSRPDLLTFKPIKVTKAVTMAWESLGPDGSV